MASNSWRKNFRITTWGESHGKAIGVELHGGERVTSRVTVSNLDHTSTFTRLMDEADLPADFIHAIRQIDQNKI